MAGLQMRHSTDQGVTPLRDIDNQRRLWITTPGTFIPSFLIKKILILRIETFISIKTCNLLHNPPIHIVNRYNEGAKHIQTIDSM
jgi:hypothetical protein